MIFPNASAHNSAIAIPPCAYTILYVEDNLANITLLETLLARRRNLTLIIARNGPDGIKLAKERLPDAIVMDINLPGLNGIDALRILRSDAATTHIPVMALSSDAYPKHIESGVREGFFAYVTKPFKIDEFMTILDAMLNKLDGSDVK